MSAPAPADRRAIIALVVAFVMLLPAVTARLNASDEIEYFAWLRSWAFDRDVDFENEYRYFHDLAPDKHPGLRETFLEGVNEAGRRPNFAPIGTALLWIPFFAAGHVAALVSGQPADGFSQPYITAVTVGSAIYGLLALLLAVDFVRRAFACSAGGAAWLTWFGTPLVFYMYVAPGFSHAASAFGASLFLWTWIQVRRDWTPWGTAALGITAALMTTIREQDALLAVGPALDFGVWVWRGTIAAGSPARNVSARWITSAFSGALAAIVAYTPQLAAYQALNGHPGPTTYVARKMNWASPHFFEVLLSPAHGLFVWTPLVLLALAALAWTMGSRRMAAPEHRWLAGLLLLMVMAQAYVSGAVESWTVAGSFGQRRFVAITPIVVAGLALLIARIGRTPLRAAGAIVITLAVWWNLGLMTLFGVHGMDRQRLEPARNAVGVFWHVPRQLPQVAWQYLTARESLYDRPRQD